MRRIGDLEDDEDMGEEEDVAPIHHDRLTAQRLTIEAQITDTYNSIQAISNPKDDGDAYQQILRWYGMHDNGEGTVTIVDDQNKQLKNQEAIVYAALKAFTFAYKCMNRLKETDMKFAAWELNGGADIKPDAENPNMIKMLHVLLAWPQATIHYFQSMHSMAAITDEEIMANLRADTMTLKQRFHISRTMNTLLSREKFKASHMILHAVLSDLRENKYVIHMDNVWKRQKVPKRVVLTYKNQRICSQCGKPESEHVISDHSLRKTCVFRPMTLPCNSDTVFDTHTYVNLKDASGRSVDVRRYVDMLCGETYHDLWYNLIDDKGSGPFVVDKLLTSGWAPQMNIRRGLFSFKNGLFDVRTDTFYPHECICHNLWYDGNEYGFPLHGLPKKKESTLRSFDVKGNDEWLFPDESGNLRPFTHVPDNHAPRYCENCRAGCCPKEWIAQKIMPAYFDRNRYWSQMRGDMCGPEEVGKITCHVCKKPYCHEDHHAQCTFRPSSTDFEVCAECGKPMDDPAHHPACKMWFSKSPWKNMEAFAKDTDSCLCCRRNYDECGCPLFAPFDFRRDNRCPVTRGIEHPTLSSIFHCQQVPEPIFDFFITLIARTILPPMAFDKMQLMVFIMGPGGNGKSTLLELMISFFDRSNTAPIANGAQPEFPFEQCIDKNTKRTKHFAYFPEVKRSCRIDTAELQKLCDAEKNYPFNVKNKPTIMSDVDFTLWAAGNEFFGTDQGDSWSRRMFLINFPHRVQDHKQDSNLINRLIERESGAILCRASIQFKHFHQRFNRSATFQNVSAAIKNDTGCNYIKEQALSMKNNIQPVHRFLRQCISQNLKIVRCRNNPDAINACIARGNFISWERFMTAYKKFHGLRSDNLTTDVWDQPFKDYGLIYDPDKLETRDVWDPEAPGQHRSTSGSFIMGIRDMDGRPAEDSDDDDIEEEDGHVENETEMVHYQESHLCSDNEASWNRFKSTHSGCYNALAMERIWDMMQERAAYLSSEDLRRLESLSERIPDVTREIRKTRGGGSTASKRVRREEDDDDDDDDDY
jgi:hypothetical protein